MPPSAWNHADNRTVSAHRCCGVSRIQMAVSSPYKSSRVTRCSAVTVAAADELMTLILLPEEREDE